MGKALKRTGAVSRDVDEGTKMKKAVEQFAATEAMVREALNDFQLKTDAMEAVLNRQAGKVAAGADRFGATIRPNPIAILQGKIAALKQSLETEIQQLSAKKSIWSFFTNFEIVTKQKKLAEISKLEDAGNSKDQLAEVASEMMKNSRVMRSMKTSRTKDLVKEILAVTQSVNAQHDNAPQSGHSS